MRLLTAHKILISTSIIFFLFFALWELRGFYSGGDRWGLASSLLYLSVSVGFTIYFKNLKRWYS